jgi:uncharacterized protein (TIGR03545 family)
MARRKLLRWRAIVPLLVFLVLVAVVSFLLLDHAVERGVEGYGTYVVGARVDLKEADVRLRQGSVLLRGLAVTNPHKPLTNLFEADEIVVDLQVLPLLEQKVAIDTVALRGVRFGTARETSGAVENPSPQSGRVLRAVSAWADAVRFPSFSLEGLGQVVDVGAVRPESLVTLTRAAALVEQVSGVRSGWEHTLRSLDPQPRIDSARSLLAQLKEADVGRLGPLGAARLVSGTRATISALGELQDGVASLDDRARADVAQLQDRRRGLAAARNVDYAYARRLLRLPPLDAPNISPALFGEAAVGWIEPVLYWLGLADQYLPPGLNPRRYAGTGRRARRAGTTVTFPRKGERPRFLLEHGDASLELGGAGVASGRYAAVISGLTSAPALYGKPLRFQVQRAGGAVGPRDAAARAVLDHVSAPLRDSVQVHLTGIALADLDLPPLGARLRPGAGTMHLSLERVGSSVAGRWVWRSAGVTWERLGTGNQEPGTGAPQLGTRAWAEDFLWRTVNAIQDVEVVVELSGAVEGPALAVRSNVGEAVSRGLRRELGREIERAQQEVRARVDALVHDGVTRAQAAVRGLEATLAREIGVPLGAIESVREELEREAARLGRLPGGIRIP